ncbi:MAG: type 2 lantipeptide synthetase LanM [Atopobiaceae bacterium]|nr:type 2 lantipeptide synthetase LanM [Atopobiaceae bacterium]
MLYERPVLRAVLGRMGESGALPASAGDLDAAAFRAAAEAVREGALDDGGEGLRAQAPLAVAYEDAIVRNCVSALAEMLERLARECGRVSSQLLGGKPVGRVRGIFSAGVDTHRHGREVLRIDAEGGSIYYKPRPWEIDALLAELADCWLLGCAEVPRFVRGDGYSFVAQVVPPASLDEEDVGEYWHHLGALSALFHGLGSRDMTEDNILCAGVRPAVIDAETLLAAGVVQRAGDAPLQPSALNSSVLPRPGDPERRSPLTTDSASGGCLPRVGGAARTVAGYERDFLDGFAVGYRRLVAARDEVAELLDQAADVPCRKVLLNTRAYVQARAGLFSAAGLADPSQRERVVRWLWDRYDGPSAERCLALARADVAALAEGDIPYYSSLAGGLTLCGADSGDAFDGVLAKSALELARDRLAMLDEAELRHELGVIEDALGL